MTWKYDSPSQLTATRTRADGGNDNSLVVAGVVQMDGSTDIAACDFPVPQAAKMMAAIAAYGARIAAGYPHSGKVIQIDPSSQGNIGNEYSRAQLALADPVNHPWPTGFYWRTADNSRLTLDAPGMRDMAVAAGDYVARLMFHLFGLKDAIAAAQTQADLDAIDIVNGWPTS